MINDYFPDYGVPTKSSNETINVIQIKMDTL